VLHKSKRLAFGLASFAFVERFLRHWRNKLNPPAPPATYLLIVNPTVLCRAVILRRDRRIATGTVRFSCPAHERVAGATHRAVGFTFNG
jgi:hypothetical protein